MTTTPILLRGGRLYGEDVADLLVADGRIDRIAAAVPDADLPAGTEVVDAAGCVVLPGLVDLHTHLREPGQEDAETVLTGTRAAAAGGFTAVHAMPNTSPVADTAGVVEQVLRLGAEAGYCEVVPIGAVTVGQAGTQLAELDAMASSRARVRVFSDDGSCVHDPLLMRRALEYVKSCDGVIAQHAQDPRLTEGAQLNEGIVASELGLAPWPGVAEESIIARDVLLARDTGSRLHVCHLSTRGSVEIVRWAKAQGIAVTAEATPHHLFFTDEEARGYDPRYKVNPPLRTADDVAAVRAGVVDGTIDIVATDHAPHPVEKKEGEWVHAANGMTGLETALPVVQQVLVDTGLLSWRDVARILSEAPARIGADAAQGRPLEPGEPAHLLVWDPEPRRAVDPAQRVSRSANTPWAGRELPGRNRLTLFHGVPTVRDGAVQDLDGRTTDER